MREISFWENLHASLKTGKAAFYVVVVTHKGSSPGKTGFKMYYDADDNLVGTIGGGIMELNICTLPSSS